MDLYRNVTWRFKISSTYKKNLKYFTTEGISESFCLSKWLQQNIINLIKGAIMAYEGQGILTVPQENIHLV